MTNEGRRPPRLALWLLERFAPPVTGDALLGDLIEQFEAGRSRRWFWTQTAAALAASAVEDVRRHWPEIAYALATPFAYSSLWSVFRTVRADIPWYALPWPFSQLVFEQTPTVLLPFASLPVLAAGLIVAKTFHWAKVRRTGLVGLLLSLALPTTPAALILTFWVAARLGCRERDIARCRPGFSFSSHRLC